MNAPEYVLSDSDFERLRGAVHRLTGIALTQAKRHLLYSRLARRVRKLELDSFAQYCALLDTGDPGERQELINAMTTNLTSFFREQHHFELLASEALPDVLQARTRKRRIRLWSAGCSTGEEAYSMAMVMREVHPTMAGWDARVLATDIDSNVLRTAAAGRYSIERLKGLDARRVSRWFIENPGQGDFDVADEVKALVTYKQMNLLEPWPVKGPFDIIFCRNVSIYFDKAAQRELFERMAQVQEPGGWLFIGHSESLWHTTRRYRLAGPTVYRRMV